MMYWNPYRNRMSGWDWFAASLSTVLFWAVLIAVGILLLRFYRTLGRGPGQPGSSGTRGTAEQVLAERFARGEIDEAEYERRLAVLRGHVSGRTEGSP
ncbi:hypothetical protein GCM10010129_68260 [Streptomyces fumigatiscleroticus]|nr:hypothetical protein GCM10010129_68260 [Streptomyces fumigatiscleroticus]